MDHQKLEKFFAAYETAFNQLDLGAIASLYAGTFLSAGPRGSQVQDQKEFARQAGAARAIYESIGQESARILSKQVFPVSNEYALVTVHWGARFRKTGEKLIEFDISYLVQDTGGDMQIILFIAHQDEEEAMKKLGLLPGSAG